ncbi:hypothetical protein JNM87_03510 [Candidatus Saccharibacteria bacterium]|nr:hypothetical protein [Candidatus Saccharibacteria bacterium]
MKRPLPSQDKQTQLKPRYLPFLGNYRVRALALYIFPKSYRQTYGNEILQLLDDLGWPLSSVLNVMHQALWQHLMETGGLRIGAFAAFLGIEYVAAWQHFTNNVFWWPHSWLSGVVLVAAVTSSMVMLFPRAVHNFTKLI